MVDNSISESIVRLLFSQLKDSDEENKDAIKDLTHAITELLKIIGTHPEDIMAELEKLRNSQNIIIDNYNKLKWIFGILIVLIGLVVTGVQLLEKIYPILETISKHK